MEGPPSYPPRRPYSGIRPRGPLVLIVEDEDSLRELYAAELAAAGFMVLEAADGATAVEKALQFGPHALVLDLMIPGVDGFKVARRLRSDDRTHDVAIVALTALTSKKFELLALGAGCDAFLSKPVIAAALIGELVRQIAKRTKGVASSPDLTRVTKNG
ncbi:MAG TPA: response regulator [Polyangiaceae bacterium]|jgi:DNA-binding response OmpR family regulator